MDRVPHDAPLPPRALTLARALATGERDPVDVTDAALAAAERARGTFITLCHDRARLEARAAKARLTAGLARSPLDGVPVAWKDVFDVRGVVTTAGSRVLARRRAPASADAPVVARATGAGLVTLGKTNMSEIAYSGLGLNPHYGTPVHPADAAPARMPGGSSSGSAVAVAAGVTPLATGSDTAGSLRVPAAFNGLVSYRPSRARHDLTGVTPLAASLDTIGPMGTSVADCIALDDVMRAGVTRARSPASLTALRVIVDACTLHDARVEGAVRANLERAMRVLADAGVRVEERPVAAVRDVLDVIAERGWLGAADAFAEWQWLLDADDALDLDPRVRKRLTAAADARAVDVIRLQRARERYARALRDELEGALLVMPTVSHVAPEIAPLEADLARFTEANREALRLTMVASFLDLPTIALPTGTNAAGLHTSVQVSALTGADERLLRAALAMSHALGIEAPAEGMTPGDHESD